MLSKIESYKLLKAERPDLNIYKVLKTWKNRHGFYWIKCKYSINKSYYNFNIDENHISIGDIPYPLSEFKKLSSADQIDTGIQFNRDEPISIDYIKRKIWYFICKLNIYLYEKHV